jgi:hypothetical protein
MMYDVMKEVVITFAFCMVAAYECYLVFYGIRALVRWIIHKLTEKAVQ